MKRLIKAVAVFAALVLAPGTVASSPQDELNRLVAQLKSNPGDNALREKIIALARRIVPPPAIPEEAERRTARGRAAFEMAKAPADFANAVREFQEAANVAPWHADAYYNLAFSQEKAGQPLDAMANYKLYLMAAPKAKDAADVKQRIYKLEYVAEQASRAHAETARKKQAEQQAEAVLDQLRQLVQTATYNRRNCITGWRKGADGLEYGIGCTVDEYRGKNWADTGSGAVGRFDFSEKGVVRHVFIGSFPAPDSIHLIGKPNGPSIADIQWECPIIEGQGSAKRITGTKPAWVDLNNDGSGITYTCDTPDPGRNPNAKYNFTWFRRN